MRRIVYLCLVKVSSMNEEPVHLVSSRKSTRRVNPCEKNERGRSYPVTVTTFSHIDRETKSQRDSPMQSHAVERLPANHGLANEDKTFLCRPRKHPCLPKRLWHLYRLRSLAQRYEIERIKIDRSKSQMQVFGPTLPVSYGMARHRTYFTT
jgi:hypothetical protein